MTRIEELEKIEQDARKKEAAAKKAYSKRRINVRKAVKRGLINDVGLVGTSVRGATLAFDRVFAYSMFMLSADQSLLGLSDEFASQFGGYTKHSIGDQMFAWTLKGATNLEKLAVKVVSKSADFSEKALKKSIMNARMR